MYRTESPILKRSDVPSLEIEESVHRLGIEVQKNYVSGCLLDMTFLKVKETAGTGGIDCDWDKDRLPASQRHGGVDGEVV